MKQQQEPLATLHEIRDIMDRSSRFISLSGLSGVAAGVSALLGAGVVKWYLLTNNIDYRQNLGNSLTTDAIWFMVVVAAFVFILAMVSATFFTARKAYKSNHRVWDSKTERMLASLFIPIVAGGIFCSILVYHDLLYLVAPAMLIFYGLGLLNTSKYTLNDIKYLGLFEIALGLLASFFVGYGLVAWTFGFGVLHIVYGTLVYFKYER